MISVTVRYHNLLLRIAGVAGETISLPAGAPVPGPGTGASLHDALERLAQRHEPPLRKMLFEPEGDISPHLAIFCNRRLVRPDQHDAPLADGDELMLFPAVAGG